ncbi:TomO hydrophobic C-terminal domain-containing protein, partial [Wolbachia pipientis]
LSSSSLSILFAIPPYFITIPTLLQQVYSHTSSKAHAQLAEKERALIDSRERIWQLEQVMENLNGKLEQVEQKSLSQQKVISDQSRKQTNYASASFVLAGMFAIGASLTPYLAVCIILAVAASIFLIAGGCCLYKANTALSDVKADQIPGVVGALNCNSSGLI